MRINDKEEIEIRVCLFCKRRLHKKNGENNRDWKKRKFCNNKCSGLNKRRPKALFLCENCKAYFEDYEGYNRRFCSHECYAESLIGSEPWNKGLKMSEEEIERNRRMMLEKWKENDFREKHSGSNNHFWKGGKSSEKYTGDWTRTLRISIRERDNYTCKICGEKQGDITHHVHHIDYNKKNCNPDNLITLCRSCHSKTNFNRQFWIKFFEVLCITI